MTRGKKLTPGKRSRAGVRIYRRRKDLKTDTLARQIRYRGGHLRTPKSLEDLYPPRLLLKMFAMIRSGVWGHVAASAVGLSKSTYYKWMKYGDAGTEPYSLFSAAVHRESSLARGGAESAVYAEMPHMWLRFGPGRDTGDPMNPGWAEETKVRHTGPGPGESAPIVRLEFTVGGPRTRIAESGPVIDVTPPPAE